MKKIVFFHNTVDVALCFYRGKIDPFLVNEEAELRKESKMNVVEQLITPSSEVLFFEIL
jgi:hypothetical protein